MKKKLIFIVGMLLLSCTFAWRTCAEDVDIPARSAIAVDVKSGKVFYEKKSKAVYEIASLTKLITIYIVLNEIKNGNLKWEDEIQVSDYALQLSRDYRLSGVPLEEGRSYSVRELYNASLIVSANACAVMLAEKISGSEIKFVDKMNETLNNLGIKDAKIVNASGLTTEFIPQKYRKSGTKNSDENKMSAKDLAILATHILKEFPEILKTTSLVEESFGSKTNSHVKMTTTNWMLKGMQNAYTGVDGLKTGTTAKAGQCFVGTVNRKNWRLVTVVLHANYGEVNHDARFTATEELMDYVYKNWSQKKILQKGKTFNAAKYFPVKDGVDEKVPLELKEDVWRWAEKSYDLGKTSIHFEGLKEGSLLAPVAQGDNAGNIKVDLLDDKLGYLEKSEDPPAPMITSKNIKKANFFVRMGRHLLEYIHKLLT
ncbi:MAG: D-alanyl-D-alanine carboxypeptidase [Streptococcaceae bacterium]|nr:D-alanyl-D-alanine carboxypeptidase [Streptococcaceae bacterium]